MNNTEAYGLYLVTVEGVALPYFGKRQMIESLCSRLYLDYQVTEGSTDALLSDDLIVMHDYDPDDSPLERPTV